LLAEERGGWASYLVWPSNRHLPRVPSDCAHQTPRKLLGCSLSSKRSWSSWAAAAGIGKNALYDLCQWFLQTLEMFLLPLPLCLCQVLTSISGFLIEVNDGYSGLTPHVRSYSKNCGPTKHFKTLVCTAYDVNNLPALQARTCSGLEPQLAANFFTLFKSDRSSSQISTFALFAIDFFATSAFSIDLQAITMFHWSVEASAFTAAKPIPRLAPVTITVLLAVLRVAAELFGSADDSNKSTMQSPCIFLAGCLSASPLINIKLSLLWIQQ
jgi:hypothetical protein